MKKFFQEFKADIKFKSAGPGQKLTESVGCVRNAGAAGERGLGPRAAREIREGEGLGAAAESQGRGRGSGGGASGAEDGRQGEGREIWGPGRRGRV